VPKTGNSQMIFGRQAIEAQVQTNGERKVAAGTVNGEVCPKQSRAEGTAMTL
jgi:hypothetical protein